MKHLLILIGFVSLLVGCGSIKTESESDAKLLAGATEALTAPGSGWADLEGDVINYEYVSFGGFRLNFRDDIILWRGFDGSFKDVVAEVNPIVSKVAEGIYFMSWGMNGGGGDNVVMNFIDMKVAGHLGAAANFQLINGPIICRNTPDCIVPTGEAMPREETMQIMNRNAIEAGFANAMEQRQAIQNNNAYGPEELLGMNELTGKTLTFETPEGLVSITVKGEETLVSVGDAEPVASPTYATHITDGVYYISWHEKPSGSHVVFNSHNMRVYDQIIAGGVREEAIYGASCFAKSC